MDSVRSNSGSLQQNGRGQSVPIDRPGGMNSLIVYNSYSNRAGAWSRASYSGRYSHSYGSIENKRYLELTTWSWTIILIPKTNTCEQNVALAPIIVHSLTVIQTSQFPQCTIRSETRRTIRFQKKCTDRKLMSHFSLFTLIIKFIFKII